jgi:hypothetical protein
MQYLEQVRGLFRKSHRIEVSVYGRIVRHLDEPTKEYVMSEDVAMGELINALETLACDYGYELTLYPDGAEII